VSYRLGLALITIRKTDVLCADAVEGSEISKPMQIEKFAALIFQFEKRDETHLAVLVIHRAKKIFQ
jgi:hypothetical protein